MKLLAGIVFLVISIFTLQVYARDRELFEPPSCPGNGLSYYKNCKGSLDQCSTCLGKAESACEKAIGACSDCTVLARGACTSSAKPMCFGNQECGSRNFKCRNFECVYDP